MQTGAVWSNFVQIGKVWLNLVQIRATWCNWWTTRSRVTNYYFDYVLKVAACEIDKQFPDGWGIKFVFNIPHLCTNREQRESGRLDGVEIVIWLLYADDLVLFCKIIAEVKTIMNILNDACSRFRLTIAFPKTKIHCFQSEKMWWTMYQSSHTLAKRSAVKIKAVLQTFVYQKHLGISMKRGRCLRTRKWTWQQELSLWGHGCDPASYMERKPGI